MWTGLPQRGADAQAGLERDHRRRGPACRRAVAPRPGCRARPSAWRPRRSGRRAIGRCAGVLHSSSRARSAASRSSVRASGSTRERPPGRGRRGRVGHRHHPPAVGALARLRPARRPDLQPTAARAVEPDVAVIRLAVPAGHRRRGRPPARPDPRAAPRAVDPLRPGSDLTSMTSPQRQVTRDIVMTGGPWSGCVSGSGRATDKVPGHGRRAGSGRRSPRAHRESLRGRTYDRLPPREQALHGHDVGRVLLKLPERNPSRSRVTNLKPRARKARDQLAADLEVDQAGQVVEGDLDAGQVALVVADPEDAQARAGGATARPGRSCGRARG